MAIARVAALALPVAQAPARRVTFAELVRDHQDEVFGLALRMLGDRDSAMDVTSTVFLKAAAADRRPVAERPDRRRPAARRLLGRRGRGAPRPASADERR